MKKVIVTGATGFVGRHCLAGLVERGYEVYAWGHRALPPWRMKMYGVMPQQINILDHLSVSHALKQLEATHLLHLAWDVKHGDFWRHRINLNWLSASIHLITEFAKNGGLRVVNAGTCAEYDWNAQGIFSEVDSPLNPTTLYGHCKKTLFELFSNKTIDIGISVAHGRLFFLYGPHESHNRLIPSVINNILKNRVAVCEHGDLIRDFIYVKDAANWFNNLLDCDYTGPFNIASKKAYSLEDIVKRIGKMMNAEDLIKIEKKTNK